ncbi:MAG: KEOPS complex subunit Pcc1 [Methanotrichaceae archaeon]
MKGRIELLFEFEEPEKIFRALTPELEDELHRSKVNLALRDGGIGLNIMGSDIASLRAALNTWVRLIKIAFEMVNI